MKIGIDVMGGDFAPEKTIHGSVLAAKNLPQGSIIVLFGNKKDILSQLKTHKVDNSLFEIVDCNQIIKMEEHAVKGFKNNPNSSISIGLQSLSKGVIDGFCSAGNTGAMLVGGFYLIKVISGILRPCISSILPKENNKFGILLDVGANTDCKADVLYQFGILGSLYAKHLFKIKSPKVGLLNIGEEKTKGNLITQECYEMMDQNNDYNFIGNIEGTSLFEENADVIVCDGFTGNIVLKEAESFYKLITKRKIQDDYFKRFNYENYGGTPILGLNKPVIVGHGVSNEIAIKNMILLTKDVIESKLEIKIKQSLK